MQMTFYNSVETTLLFSWWKTNTVVEYAITLGVCFFAGIITVLMKVGKNRVERLFAEKELIETEQLTFFYGVLLYNNFIRMLLAFISVSLDMCLMLIVMSFNLGVFFAVVIGISIGHFLFGSFFNSTTVNSKICAPGMNVEMRCDDGYCCDMG